MKSIAVSIVLPFRDDEHLIGRATRSLAEHFQSLDHSFEIIAVDEGSGDNSHAVLALLRHEIPNLQVVVGKGYATGSARAKGKALLLLELAAVAEGLTSSLSRALEAVLSDELDMQLVAEEMIVSERHATLKLLTEGLVRRQRSPRGLLVRGRDMGLRTQSYGPETRSMSDSGLGRIISALVPRGTGLHRA
jgi:glycosyltransferase involved in cell wall biosynthesis